MEKWLWFFCLFCFGFKLESAIRLKYKLMGSNYFFRPVLQLPGLNNQLPVWS